MNLFTIPESTPTDNFADFWSGIVPGMKKNPKGTRSTFKKLSAKNQAAAIAGYKREVEYRAQMAASGQWVGSWRYPQTWLNQEGWLDELMIPEQDSKTSDAPWKALISKLGEVGRNDYPSWDDPNIAIALYKVSSWMEICTMPEKKMQFEIKPRFMEEYSRLTG